MKSTWSDVMVWRGVVEFCMVKVKLCIAPWCDGMVW